VFSKDQTSPPKGGEGLDTKSRQLRPAFAGFLFLILFGSTSNIKPLRRKSAGRKEGAEDLMKRQVDYLWEALYAGSWWGF